MPPVIRRLMKSNEGALTPRYTIISGVIALLIALTSIAIKLAVLSAHASGT